MFPHIQSKRKTVGIRISDNSIIREIVRELGNPIMSTSSMMMMISSEKTATIPQTYL